MQCNTLYPVGRLLAQLGPIARAPHGLQSLAEQTARCLVTVTGLQLPIAVQRDVPCTYNRPSPFSAQHTAGSAVQLTAHRTFFNPFLKLSGKAYKERRLIGYSPAQLYDVVSNVQNYHQFVPWCVGSQVLNKDGDGSTLEAELQIGFQMISERYTSRVKLQPPHMVSSTVINSALFHHLESIWQMTPGPTPNTTWLSFSVDFAFLNPLYANLAQLFFSEVVTRMMGAFEGRCQQLHGPPSIAPVGHLRHKRHHQQLQPQQPQQQHIKQHSHQQQRIQHPARQPLQQAAAAELRQHEQHELHHLPPVATVGVSKTGTVAAAPSRDTPDEQQQR